MERVVWPSTLSLLVVVFTGPALGEEAKQNMLVSQWRHIIATKISVDTLEKGRAVYTDRPSSIEEVPQELVGWTLITISSELRMAKHEGLCFTIDRPARVYVGNHERIKDPPDWLKKQFEKTALKIKAHQSAAPGGRAEDRWNFELWCKSFPAGFIAFGRNKNEALPHIVLVEKGVQLTDIHYGGPMPVADLVGGTVTEGGLAYTDRTYVLKGVPAEMLGTTMLAMKQAYALENGRYTGPHLRVPWLDTAGREVQLAHDATAYIAYDASSTSLPEWIEKAGFKKTALSLKVTQMKLFEDRPMVVYSRQFKAGEKLWLGPNRGPGWEGGWPLQYLAMLKPTAPAR